MKAIDAYQIFLALRQHFADNEYDYFKYHGKLTVNARAFYGRKDRFLFEKLLRKFKNHPEDLRNFFLANMLAKPDIWIYQLLDDAAFETYANWQKYTESLEYNFIQEMSELHTKHANKSFNDLFVCPAGQHPLILESYMLNELSIESLILLDCVLGSVFSRWNKAIDDTIIWPDTYQKCRAYQNFLLGNGKYVDVPKLKKLLKKEFVE